MGLLAGVFGLAALLVIPGGLMGPALAPSASHPSLSRGVAGVTPMYHFGGWLLDNFSGSPLPTARYGASMAVDPTDGLIVVFGGCGRVCPMNDTWVYGSLSTSYQWVNITSKLSVSPPARYDAASVNMWYGPYSRSGMFLFGGHGASGALNDTWEFIGHHWKQLTFPNHRAPSPRFSSSWAEMGNRNEFVLFGGTDGTHYSNQTWLFDQKGGWKHLHPALSPPARAGAALAFSNHDGNSAAGGGEILVGGNNASTVLGDDWDFSNYALDWYRETGSPSLPPPLTGSGMASDMKGVIVTLFGGWNGSAPTVGNWVHHDGQGGPWVWFVTHPRTHPSARSDFPMISFDGGRTLLLFGGRSSTGAPLGDFWAY
ncbi:MAG: hypothetical protein L3K09_05290 [Thermoplasmata archaeon]|nr:hypothetical protein [Thermoplasmata archaeon]